MVGALDGVFEPGERVRPELGKQAPHRVQRLVSQRVQATGAVAALDEQACLLQDRDVWLTACWVSANLDAICPAAASS